MKELARSILATPTGREGCFSPNRCRAPAMGSLPAGAAAAAGGLAAVALESTCLPCVKTILLWQACCAGDVVSCGSLGTHDVWHRYQSSLN